MPSNTSSKPTSFPTVIVNQNEQDPSKGGSYVQVPRFWIDDYFSSHVTWTFGDGSKKKGTRVPASFWKYTLHLWRYVTIPQFSFQTRMSMDAFPVRPDAAVMWTSAYAFSGVMKVTFGKWTKKHDDPTQFIYDPATSHADWRCFFTALDMAYADMQSGRQNTRTEKRGMKIGANLSAWKVLIAREVDTQRKRAGLPLINQQFLDDAAAGRIWDNYGREIANRDKDGTVQPCFYVKQRLQKAGETDDEFESRLCYEAMEEDERGW